MKIEELTTSKNWSRVIEGIKELTCFDGYATVVTVPIVIDGNVIIVRLSEPSLNDRIYHNLSPYFNKKRGNK
ncbi:hypothetical protein [Streptococcus parauberis]|uniref:hypothetical protein n=1 Tax=Streptococcus parauberis TaxID=1348 RepID=UPI000C15E691|nr:hypothetical protein [Streptococcus parauberis]PIA83681.1 hypothetical protein ADO07_01549 [Streptococcus parauberis]